MPKYYLAIDIGASSGRHMLGYVENGELCTQEIYRFSNQIINDKGELYWDIEGLFDNIIIGLKKCAEIGKIPISLGIDTWGVDFVLLDNSDSIIGRAISYRDKRTEGMDELVYSLIPKSELYEKTGIQKQMFNTIFQLMAIKTKHPEYFKRASSFLMLPDYLNFLLTGKKTNEYTNATTTQLIDPETKTWSREIIEKMGFPYHIFKPLSSPGTSLGNICENLAQEIGYNIEVIIPATHDTASAVAAVPSVKKDFLYISSGTWSLIGTEIDKPKNDRMSELVNFTNEGAYNYRYRYLKNLIGLWVIQKLKVEFGNIYTYPEICDLAEQNADFPSRLDLSDNIFVAPDSMESAIKEYCKITGQAVPNTFGEMASCFYSSLADSYKMAIDELESLMGEKYDEIHIIGGGSKADYLNRICQKVMDKKIYAGPSEATAIGNLFAQMIKNGEYKSLQDARASILKCDGLVKIVN